MSSAIRPRICGLMIRTGQLLADIAASLGYEVTGIELFRTRLATATGEANSVRKLFCCAGPEQERKESDKWLKERTPTRTTGIRL